MAQTYAHELKGKKVSIGHGFAQSFVRFNYHHEPTSVGIILSKEALDGLSNTDQSYSLNMPAEANIPPYKEIYIDWNAHGHEPTGIYDIPHFDFHFYGISKQERENIMCTGTDAEICTRMPDQDSKAPFYIPTPAGVPMMGWHWLDSRAPELNGKRFTSTFIYGYYNGKLIFSEPMITREFLLAKGTVNHELPVPKNYAINGHYPKKYTVNFDATKNVYRIVLKELVLRDSGK